MTATLGSWLGFFHVPGTRSSTHSCRACPAGQFKAGENGGTHCSAITIATCPIGKLTDVQILAILPDAPNCAQTHRGSRVFLGKQLTAGTGSSNGFVFVRPQREKLQR